MTWDGIEFGPCIGGRPRFGTTPIDAKSAPLDETTRQRAIVGIACFYDLPHMAAKGRAWDIDVFEHKCFQASLAIYEPMICKLHNHHRRYGEKGDLEVQDSPDGLAFKFSVGDDASTELFEDVASGGYTATSVGFRAMKTHMLETKLGKKVRIIQEAFLKEISIVTSPAVPGTGAYAVTDAAGLRLEDHKGLALHSEASWRVFRARIAGLSASLPEGRR